MKLPRIRGQRTLCPRSKNKDNPLVFGFIPDDKYEGLAVKVREVVGDSSFCTLVGIQTGDILVRVGGEVIESLDDLERHKLGKRCGDSVWVTILRENEELDLRGRFSPPRKYKLLMRNRSSARIEGYFAGNKFTLRTSQVGAFSIYIHPDMVQLDQNVLIELNGKQVFYEKVVPSLEFILRNFLENRDREYIFVNKISG